MGRRFIALGHEVMRMTAEVCHSVSQEWQRTTVMMPRRFVKR
jgi:hypothetical protein